MGCSASTNAQKRHWRGQRSSTEGKSSGFGNVLGNIERETAHQDSDKSIPSIENPLGLQVSAKPAEKPLPIATVSIPKPKSSKSKSNQSKQTHPTPPQVPPSGSGSNLARETVSYIRRMQKKGVQPDSKADQAHTHNSASATLQRIRNERQQPMYLL